MGRLLKWLLLTVLIIDLGLGAFFLYQYAGLKYFIKASMLINNSTASEATKIQEWQDFTGKTENEYTGIYAGNYLGRVWVWGRSGPRSFTVDKYSFYTFFDGCTNDILNATDPQEPYSIVREIYYSIGNWKKKVKVGDFVEVVIARDGIRGNLREGSAYNFWLFLQKDQRTRCAE